MAIEPNHNTPEGAETTREWEKLLPAVKKSAGTPATVTRSSAPSAAGKEAEQVTDPAPWTAPLEPVVTEPAAVSAAPVARASQARDAAEPVVGPESPQLRARKTQKKATEKPRFLVLRRLIITLSVPLITLMLAVRFVASSAFLWAEYHRPGFPADTYGFDTAERMRLGSYGLDYILNLAPESYLADIQTGGVAAFLPTEVEHMTDVKRVILCSLTLAALMLVAALLSARTLPTKAPGLVRSSLFTGSLLTLLLATALGVSGILGWESFFTTFHQVFFPQGNWQFRMSDTLIRLYPPQFWLDAALTAGIIVLLVTLVLLVSTWPTARRRQEALKRRAANQKA
ncbi:TIGR01906 family membrane protein [Rothia sp. P4278]|uniref:TIGR01906 family membrane protein n=1 Tax=Rothia sp. P4278 TaxID=3402658 RepID=UPI003ADE5F77